MEFDFVPWETDVAKEWLPMLPIQLNGFPVGNCLVDTGATITILPSALSNTLGVDLDHRKAIVMNSAGGGTFTVSPGTRRVTYCINHSGFRPIEWEGTVFFGSEQDVILLGHYECLDQLTLTLDGPRRELRVEQRQK